MPAICVLSFLRASVAALTSSLVMPRRNISRFAFSNSVTKRSATLADSPCSHPCGAFGFILVFPELCRVLHLFCCEHSGFPLFVFRVEPNIVSGSQWGCDFLSYQLVLYQGL